jgi:stage IV sporulation protein B
VGAMIYFDVVKKIPDSVFTVVGTDSSVDLSLPVQLSDSVEALHIKNTGSGFHINPGEEGSYDIDVKLFGMIPLKKMNVNVISQYELAPLGEPMGIYVKTKGLLVLGTDIIEGENGFQYEPAANIIKEGDYIVKWEGNDVRTFEDIQRRVFEGKGKKCNITIDRNGMILPVSITPAKAKDGSYKLGIWVREDTQGIGTVTYVARDGTFGALGHGITDADTGKLMKSEKGELFMAEILSVIKGKPGKPGELEGIIDMKKDAKLGVVTKNTPLGIYGKVSDSVLRKMSDQFLPIGMKQDVNLGKAKIRTRINGNIKDFDIVIEEKNLTSSDNKSMVIRVIDKNLLKMTGGIVQGMSGSPIIQGNKVVGAVTHVLVGDSTKGYGIFIENMISAQNS